MAHKKGKGFTGRIHSEQTKRMISSANAGRKWSEQNKNKHSIRMSGSGNSMYGKVHPNKGKKFGSKKLDINKLQTLIEQGYHNCQIESELNTTEYLIGQNIKQYIPEMAKKLRYNNIHNGKGRNTWLKGKTYEEIFKSKEKANKRKKQTSDWMKTEKNIRRFCKWPSKPQVELFQLIKIKYENARLEHPIKTKNRTIWLDIALVKEKINVEYDGTYWHELNGGDEMRDKILKEKGWKIIRIKEGDDAIKKLKRGGLKF